MKYFLFDMGGVIVKPMKTEEIYKNFEWNISYEEFLYEFSKSEKAIAHHKGQITVKEYFTYIKQYMKTNASYEDYVNAYIKSKQFPYEDTIDVIHQIKKKGYKVYILSNLREIDFKLYQEKFDVTIFDDFFLSYELNMLKPEKEIYLYVQQKLKANPSDIYFFDDIKENIDSAKKLGFNTYQVTGKTIKQTIKERIPTLYKI